MTSRPASSYVTGPIGVTMIRTAFAMLAGTLAISGYNIANTWFVSKLGTVQLAAMGFTFPVVMLIGCIYRGCCVGVMTPVAHALGRGRHDRAARLVTSGLMLLMLISLVIGTVGALTVVPVFRFCGADESVMGYILQYMLIWYIGSFTGTLGLAANDLLIAAGDSLTASMLMMGGLVLNIILDPLFIFGWFGFPEMGVVGAALGTVIAQALSAAAALLLLHGRHRLIASPRIPRKVLLEIWGVVVRFAIPATLGMLLMPIGSFVTTRIVASFGNEAVAAVAAASRLEVVAFVFPMALGIALMPMVAQNYGARRFDRINQCRRFAMRFAGVFLLVAALVFFVAAPHIVGWFSEDPEVMRIMTAYLRIVPFGFAAVEIHRFSGFFFTGCGRPTVAALLNALRVVVFLIPLSLLALCTGSLMLIFGARLAADLLAGGIACVAATRMTRRLYSEPHRQTQKKTGNSQLATAIEMLEEGNR